MTDEELIKTLAKIELSRRDELGSFYYYCQLMAPEFYTPEKVYLYDLCNRLEAFIYDDTKKYLSLSVPPRFGKSLTCSMLCSFLLGKQPNLKIMTGSYNEDFATLMCKNVRNRIQATKMTKEEIVHNDIFFSQIEKGSSRANQFKVDGAKGTISMLATSPSGSATGYPSNLIILDDLLKSASESYSTKRKDELYDNYFKNTLLSRLEGETRKVLIINTRWVSDDITGRLLEDKKDELEQVEYINLPCMNEKGELLCESIINLQQYNELKSMLAEDIFQANYNGICIDLKDKLYQSFNCYRPEPIDDKCAWEKTFAICDLSGDGDDSTVVIIASTSKIIPNKILVRHIYKSNKVHAKEEEVIAKLLTDYGCTHFRYEKNGAGAYFGKVLQEELNKLGNKFTILKSYAQSQSKDVKIFANRRNVERFIMFPEGWDNVYREFFKEVFSMKSVSSSWDHDDCADAMTELFIMGAKFQYIKFDLMNLLKEYE
jgi:predicted phage terminase large subunit-like protein